MDERQARLWLHLCPGLTRARRQKLLSGIPAQQAVELLQSQGLGPKSETFLRACQADWLDITDSDYPSALRHLHDPPELLFCRGNRSLLGCTETAVTVIGTRRCSPQGRHLASRLSVAITQAGLAVVSGFARGIDTAAHWASLEGTNPKPLAVLACGLDVCYPSENRHLLHQLEQHGLVISEYPPGTPPMSHNFQMRNRLLAALCQAVLVIESPMRSGVMLTVNHAMQLGREVFVLPGPVGHPSYEGNLHLLFDGAALVRSPLDLLQQLKGAALQSFLPMQSPAAPEEWAQRLGLSLPETLRQLSQWEQLGGARRTPEGYFTLVGVGLTDGWGATAAGNGGRSRRFSGNFSK